ncbi:unnamed protein product [Rhizophagus irregularis]|uniref:Myb-like domain-containing protein n=2 Tax=Rhizophagus irregularis TaxID=588596 RepID=A0A915ZW09_9GLOM|nr:unnamed protein product [Rhizophagus irregularis]CAB5389228.1 unnamed protein product [Rhizophagus irregularis]
MEKWQKKALKEKIKRKSNKIFKTIDENNKKIILDYMEEWKKRGKIPKNPFVELSKKLKNRYNSKAICDYYWNILDPRLNHEPFSQEEKEYIYKWGEKYQETNDGNIQWRFLQPKMEAEFGKFRSRNSLKNIWNTRKKQVIKDRAQINISDEVDKENKDDYKICKSENEDEIEFDECEDKNEAKPFTKHSIQFLLNDNMI